MATVAQQFWTEVMDTRHPIDEPKRIRPIRRKQLLLVRAGRRPKH